MACKLKLIPVACSHILKLLAVSVSFLASILDQLDQISSLLARSKWLAFVKQLTVATGTSSGSSLDGWVLARKMFLQRQTKSGATVSLDGKCILMCCSIHDEEP